MAEISEQIRLSKEIVLAKIPAFPPVILRVLDLLSAEEPNMAQLVGEISADATLSAQILRLANSPLYGLAAQVRTVQQAIVVLGFVSVQALVMAVATTNYMRASLHTDALQTCWRHTMATAILSRELARAALQSPDSAYSLGLLHDIGRLGLLVAYPGEYSQILKAADRDAVSLLDQEKSIFGMDHCEAGRSLLEQATLPEDFCMVVGRHHDPPQGCALDSLKIGYLACQMADTLGYSVVTPLKPVPFEELRSMLPVAAQRRFPAEPGSLLEQIDRAILDANAASTPAPRDVFPPPELRAFRDREFLTAPRGDWFEHDFTIVLVTATVFAVVLFAFGWLFRS
jgi:HD-like signal output (HDOD) protein